MQKASERIKSFADDRLLKEADYSFTGGGCGAVALNECLELLLLQTLPVKKFVHVLFRVGATNPLDEKEPGAILCKGGGRWFAQHLHRIDNRTMTAQTNPVVHDIVNRSNATSPAGRCASPSISRSLESLHRSA